jgi:dolichol-phosphate mannosyltransferase
MYLPELSIVVPTRNESNNVPILLDALREASIADRFEVIFVDDSTDDTPSVVRAASSHYPFDVRLLHREHPVGGLSGAVVDGIRTASAPYVVVMDGDMQHPAALVPTLLQRARDGAADVVVASRYADGGAADGLDGGVRRLGSRLTTALAHIAFPRRLAACTDPMSGFFCANAAAFDLDRLRPQGFKILLELVVRGSLSVAEVPMVMAPRAAGASKAGLREFGRYLRHLFVLRVASAAARFAIVGLIGGIVNLALVAALIKLGVDDVASMILAVQAAVAVNFVGTELLVFHDRRAHRLRRRAAVFEIVGMADLLRIPFVLLLTRVGVGPVVGTAVTLVLAFVARYAVVSRTAYRRRSGVPTAYPDPIALSAVDAVPTAPLTRSDGPASDRLEVRPRGLTPANTGNTAGLT